MRYLSSMLWLPQAPSPGWTCQRVKATQHAAPKLKPPQLAAFISSTLSSFRLLERFTPSMELDRMDIFVWIEPWNNILAPSSNSGEVKKGWTSNYANVFWRVGDTSWKHCDSFRKQKHTCFHVQLHTVRKADCHGKQLPNSLCVRL